MLIWISGASTGLGYFLSEELKRRGDRLVLGARSFNNSENSENAENIKNNENGEALLKLRLDITDKASIDNFTENALKMGTPDVLINAAGAMRFGAMEDIGFDELQAVLNVNLFGTLSMTREFLKARPRGGLVVNFSSINGLLSTPFQGAYSISKHGIEAMTEAFQAENSDSLFMLVEPGDHRGGSEKSRVFSKNASERHKKALERATSRIVTDENNGSSPEKFARKLADAIHKKTPPLRLRIASADQHLAVLLHDLLPSRLFNRIIGSYYSK